MTPNFEEALARCPLVAIIRGVHPGEVVAIGGALIDAGFSIVEVPLNSPEPLRSIRLLADHFGNRALIGAGTVMSPADVASVRDAGGRIIVMPHADAAVIRAAKVQGLACVPGVATPTEAFAAMAAGADGMKLFPAEGIPPQIVKAWRAVVPPAVKMLAVGGINAGNMAAYLAAGASGFGLGTSLYAPGRSPAAVADAARTMLEAYGAAKAEQGARP